MRAASFGRLPSCLNPSLLLKQRHPSARVVADLGPDAIEKADAGTPAGQHRELVVEALQVELADDGGVTLLDQEAAGFG